jgi:hypothetical protein
MSRRGMGERTKAGKCKGGCGICVGEGKHTKPAAKPKVDPKQAVAACRLLVYAYEQGEESQEVDWNDVDAAHEAARQALGLEE